MSSTVLSFPSLLSLCAEKNDSKVEQHLEHLVTGVHWIISVYSMLCLQLPQEETWLMSKLLCTLLIYISLIGPFALLVHAQIRLAHQPT